MNNSQFSEIYKKLKEISTQGIKDAERINEKIEQELEEEIKNTPEFEAWKKSGFSLDHVFNIDERQHALLIRACQNSDVEMVKFLLGTGASVNVIAGEDNPFTIIIEKLYGKERAESILNLLLQKLTSHVQEGKESVNLTIKKAIERGNFKVFNELKDAGANFNIEAYEGCSLLKWAEMHKECTNKEDMEKIINHLKTAKNVKPSVSSEKSDATFWSKHKGKIALSIVTLFAAGAVTAFMFDLPIVALVLVASAVVTLMAIGIDKIRENSPATEVHEPSTNSESLSRTHSSV
uniref:Ankyrin repeat domain protein n=1 Tax=Wolbachia endosymbiont of Oeneis ivallda TaxID=3171168 RepID=A0AAU7YKM3_9RICK